MTATFVNCAGMSSTTAGIGSVTLAAALGVTPNNVTSSLGFTEAGVIDGQTIHYRISDVNGHFEVGVGSTLSGTMTRSVVNSSLRSTITVTIASPGVITWNNHGLIANQQIVFYTIGALPTGLIAGTVYFVVGSSITTNTFQVSATSGGTAINTSGSQSGTHTAYAQLSLSGNEQVFITVLASDFSNSAVLSSYVYVASSNGQTTFSGADSNGHSLSYFSANTIIVSVNGGTLAYPSDYTASDGASVILTVGANIGDVIVIQSFQIIQTTPTTLFKAPTFSLLTSASTSPYTPPSGVTWIEVKGRGGGSGGIGSGTAPGTVPTAGGDTTFGVSLLTANGGTIGSFSSNLPGVGGGFTVNAPAIAGVCAVGANGGMGGANSGTTSVFQPGGAGGGEGGGYGGLSGTLPRAASANSGGGGGGGGINTTVGSTAGGGGAEGGYFDAIIAAPLSSYAFSIGLGGSAGGAGTSGFAGAAGAAGWILVEEHYDATGAVSVASVFGRQGNVVAQSGDYSTQALPLPQSYLAGLQLSNDSTSPNSVIDVEAGQCRNSTNVANIVLAAFTKSTGGAWVAGSGSNGMGNGLTVAANTWYHVFAIINGGVADVYLDTSVTAANKPSGTTAYRRIGSFMTDGSSHILAFVQVGNTFYWQTPVRDVNAATFPTSPASATLTVPPGLVVFPLINVELSNNSTFLWGRIYSPLLGDNNASANSNIGIDVFASSTTGLEAYNSFSDIASDTSQHVRYVNNSTNSGTITIYTCGWIDTRGKDN